LFQHVTIPSEGNGEYYYSYFFRLNFTLIARIIFFIIGLGAGYFFKLNPWLAGTCLILIFPATSLLEATIYKGSHNLLGFEFVFLVHVCFAKHNRRFYRKIYL
jgi:hypothetical protein